MRLSLLLSALVLSLSLSAQDTTITKLQGQLSSSFPSVPDLIFLSEYKVPSQPMALVMEYGSEEIENLDDWNNEAYDKKPVMVDLVMTLHPADTNTWASKYNELIRSRLKELYYQDNSFLIDTGVTWRLVLQTGPTSESEARNYFHGFVLYYNELDSKDSEAYISCLRNQLAMYTAETAQSKELQQVFERNKKLWNNMLVITDCTFSMLPYAPQTLIWHMLQDTGFSVRHYAFFNDGDGKTSDEKRIGNTGGIYFLDSPSRADLVNQWRMATKMGTGNSESEENDFEAVLAAMDYFDDYNDIVLVVDGNSPVRDYVLLSQINKPVRIVLCGASSGSFCKAYYDLALATGGSLHTMEQDMSDLTLAHVGSMIEINGEQFEISPNRITQITK